MEKRILVLLFIGLLGLALPLVSSHRHADDADTCDESCIENKNNAAPVLEENILERFMEVNSCRISAWWLLFIVILLQTFPSEMFKVKRLWTEVHQESPEIIQTLIMKINHLFPPYVIPITGNLGSLVKSNEFVMVDFFAPGKYLLI
jgi:hypothetical protein